ncbi:MAG TPA: 4'-phosphopantetheinyl transferase superfamily protein [Candidatus Dormibacteraeota bacterium]|nr:4'-phosphopantetheinyl transferase superfamily protein [Candidatus Dormibacteraeota bacterium]
MSGIRALALPEGVHVAAAPLSALDGLPAAAADLRTAAPLPAWRAREHLAARALLRRLLAELVHPAAARSPLAARDGGQPHLPECPGCELSLSHTDGWAAAAVRLTGGAGARVGIDIQRPEPVGTAVVRRCCGPTARARLAELSAAERDLELAWIWTVQEACVKAAGAGLSGRPWTIPVDVGQRSGRWRQIRWTALRTDFAVPVSCAREVPDRAPRAELGGPP